MAVALRPSASTDGCAIRSKTGFARTQPWPARSVCSRRIIDRTRPSLELIKITQAPLAAEVARRVDHGLDPQGALVFQVLLDAGVLVEGVDGDLGAAGDDLGLEPPEARAAARTRRSKMISIVSGRPRSRLSVTSASKKARAWRGCVEHDRAGHLHLGHGQLPPVPGALVVRAQGQRQPGQPALEEHLNGSRLQHVADPLEQGGILGEANPLDNSVKPSPALRACCLAHSWPFTPRFSSARDSTWRP